MKRAKPKTKSNATPAQLREALERLLYDVISGNLSGRNPYSLDSVKAAKSALTGKHWQEGDSRDFKHEGQA